MEEIIALASGKGGVGKTFLSINITLALQQLGKDVKLIDGDTTSSNLGGQLGITEFGSSLQDVLEGENIQEALHVHSSGLKFVPSSFSLNKINTSIYENQKRFRSEIKKLKGSLIFDTPSGLTKDSQILMALADKVVIVSNPDVPSIIDAAKVSELVDVGDDKFDKKVKGLILNRIKNSKYGLNASEIEVMCSAPIIAKLKEEKIAEESIYQETPLVKYKPNDDLTNKIKEIARNLS